MKLNLRLLERTVNYLKNNANVKKEFTLNDDFPYLTGLRRLYLDENCKQKYGFTDEEFILLNKLRYFDKHE